MPELLLFIDSSVNPQTRVGYGAFLATTDLCCSLAELRSCVKLKRFEQTSSTRLELQTLLWALSEIQDLGSQLRLYTDSQNIIGLPGRRARLEKNAYLTRSNKLLGNHELYQEFYRRIDQRNCELIKVRGHQPAKQKDGIDQIFSLVDRASRKALGEEFP